MYKYLLLSLIMVVMFAGVAVPAFSQTKESASTTLGTIGAKVYADTIHGDFVKGVPEKGTGFLGAVYKEINGDDDALSKYYSELVENRWLDSSKMSSADAFLYGVTFYRSDVTGNIRKILGEKEGEFFSREVFIRDKDKNVIGGVITELKPNEYSRYRDKSFKSLTSLISIEFKFNDSSTTSLKVEDRVLYKTDGSFDDHDFKATFLSERGDKFKVKQEVGGEMKEGSNLLKVTSNEYTAFEEEADGKIISKSQSHRDDNGYGLADVQKWAYFTGVSSNTTTSKADLSAGVCKRIITTETDTPRAILQKH